MTHYDSILPQVFKRISLLFNFHLREEWSDWSWAKSFHSGQSPRWFPAPREPSRQSPSRGSGCARCSTRRRARPATAAWTGFPSPEIEIYELISPPESGFLKMKLTFQTSFQTKWRNLKKPVATFLTLFGFRPRFMFDRFISYNVSSFETNGKWKGKVFALFYHFV